MMDTLITNNECHELSRRHLALLALGACLPGWAMAQAAAPVVQVWKDPNCGCCKDWIAHLEKKRLSHPGL